MGPLRAPLQAQLLCMVPHLRPPERSGRSAPHSAEVGALRQPAGQPAPRTSPQKSRLMTTEPQSSLMMKNSV
jgi:hypothetical protein